MLKHLLVQFSCHEILIEHQRQELAAFDQFNLYQCFRRLVSDRHKKVLDTSALKKFMHENSHGWVGEREALLFITEFSNETLREAEGMTDNIGLDLAFAEFQRCFLPCESAELRASLSQRACTAKQVYLPLPIEERIANLIGKEIEFL